MHLPFRFLDRKYTLEANETVKREREREKEKGRRDERGCRTKGERREEKGLIGGREEMRYRICCPLMRNRHVVDIVRDLPLPVAELSSA